MHTFYNGSIPLLISGYAFRIAYDRHVVGVNAKVICV
jgi:hypothetical protein